MKIKKADILVIVPHPDDAEYGAAGTIASYIKRGKEVAYVICTKGDKGTSDRTVKPEDLVKTRRQEQMDAASTLGVRYVEFLNYPDQGLEDTDEFRKELVRYIRMYKPSVMITVDPHQYYIWWHRDHRKCGRVAMDAVFPYARDHLSYPELLEEGLEPYRVSEVMLFNADKPNYKVDITETFSLKIDALMCHKSQVGEDRSKVETRLLTWAQESAKDESFDLAEVFHRIEMP